MQVAGITSNKQQNPNFGMLKVELNYKNKIGRAGFDALGRLEIEKTALGVENGKVFGIVKTIKGTSKEKIYNHDYLNGTGISIGYREANKLIKNAQNADFFELRRSLIK